MARQLKSDLIRLQQVFTNTHDRFRILNSSVDEVTCRFFQQNKTFYDVQANIPSSYPSEPPLWFVISDHEAIVDLLEEPLEALNKCTEERDNRIINQVTAIVELLCRIHEEPCPEELNELKILSSVLERDEDTGNESDELNNVNADGDEEEFESECEDEECSDNDESYDNDEMFEINASGSNTTTGNPTECEMDAENAQILRKQKNLQYGKQSSANSSKVLLKELDTIYRSETYKNKTYSVELVEDALDVWDVKLMLVCPDSLLQLDLHRLREQGLNHSIHMRITFEETFPYSAPFIQVTYPAIKGGHVLDEGALCMELLTKQGWSSAYSMENVLMQVSSTLITGNARVDFDKTKIILRTPYSQERAREMFEYHANLHKNNGWKLPDIGSS
ncbi:ubiquitin-conjugating enzyme E2 Q2-like [Bradysia coprophila]|uniref:ubiquitin-conjugating enzyme E2 Q2-like n=1 Tax=Bradysia coprophila TaxID=38358 RepID=UPI00187DC30D|nr:ubiquitin-conjugating enzyme E2 Q2-like [Bradysia coprophila]